MRQDINVSEVVRMIGGVAETARLCDMRNSQAVSNWIARNRIPGARLTFLKVVRPDVFEKLGTGQAACHEITSA
jgi:hypothetical protein